jgi:hypothetical protein
MHHPDGLIWPVNNLQPDGAMKDAQVSHSALPFGVS